MTIGDLPEDFATPAALAATEEGEPDESIITHSSAAHSPQPTSSWSEAEEFDAFITGLGLHFFSPSEFLVKGGSNSSGNCAGRNGNPPRDLWPNIAATARVLDQLRARLGYSVTLTSAYRTPPYNACISGAQFSQHVRFNAADFQGSSGSPSQWADALREMRDSNVFRGGIGRYATFIHVDTRGQNADW